MLLPSNVTRDTARASISRRRPRIATCSPSSPRTSIVPASSSIVPLRAGPRLVAAFALVAMAASGVGAQATQERVPGRAPVELVAVAEAHDAFGTPRTVRIAGRATVGSGVLHARALDVAIDDGARAMRVFRRQPGSVAVAEGDSVEATGVVKRYRGALELEASDVRVIPGPRRIVPPLLLPGAVVEPSDEGRLVEVHGVAGEIGRSEGGWWLTVVADPAPDGRRNTVTVWVGAAHAMPPSMERVRTGDRVEVTGVLSAFQDNPTEPRVWQVLPRGEADVALPGMPAYLRERLRWALALSAIVALLVVALSRLIARRQRRALREVEDRYQQLLALSPEAVLVFGEGTVRFANPAAARLLGAEQPESLTGQPIARFWPDEHGATAAPTRTRLVTLEGEPVDVEAAASPCRFHDRPATVVLARDVRAQLRHERELRALAQLDELTGLFNRRGFQLHAETMRREHAEAERPLALVLADLDGLKAINDTFGHPAGDAAIRAVADALRGALGDDALVARWGGDEFAAIVALPVGSGGGAGVTSAMQALDARLQQAVARVPATAGKTRVEARASVGVAMLATGVVTAETLGVADEKLYARKRERRGLLAG
jgi:diguanylate cyclase (GGDEF)-like protein